MSERKEVTFIKPKKSFCTSVAISFVITCFMAAATTMTGIICALSGLGAFYIFHISLRLSPVRSIMISSLIVCAIMFLICPLTDIALDGLIKEFKEETK